MTNFDDSRFDFAPDRLASPQGERHLQTAQDVLRLAGGIGKATVLSTADVIRDIFARLRTPDLSASGQINFHPKSYELGVQPGIMSRVQAVGGSVIEFTRALVSPPGGPQ